MPRLSPAHATPSHSHFCLLCMPYLLHPVCREALSLLHPDTELTLRLLGNVGALVLEHGRPDEALKDIDKALALVGGRMNAEALSAQ